jgi:hypothetical protein
LIAGSLVVFVGLLAVPRRLEWRGRTMDPFQIVISVVPAVLAIYFVLTTDWSRAVQKVAWLEPLRLWLAAYSTRMPLPPIHPNTVGGMLAMWLPLQIAALIPQGNLRRSASYRACALSLLGLSLATLVLTRLRGAWLALALAVAVRLLWRQVEALSVATRRILGGVAVTVLVLLGGAMGPRWLAFRPDRMLVWIDSWQLRGDYVFTGLGLGNFSMPFSSYALLVHVPHTMHAHNLFLDVWLEQGLLGFASFTAVMLMPLAWWFARATGIGSEVAWREAGLAALMVVLFHGLIDDALYGYDGLGTPLLFAPLAVLVRTGGPAASWRFHPRVKWPTVAAAGAVLVVLWFGWNARARWHANLGALEQTKAELSTYRWPQWPIQDAVRRERVGLLAPAIANYRQALVLDPNNAQANRRLGQIELSLGEFDNARQLLEAAYWREPSRTTRQLYGESLALTGEPARAAEVWKGLDFPENQLGIRLWWYGQVAERPRVDWLGEAISLSQASPVNSNF